VSCSNRLTAVSKSTAFSNGIFVVEVMILGDVWGWSRTKYVRGWIGSALLYYEGPERSKRAA